MAKPTSLEQQCFLHILQHLEKFSVESLSLLPLGIRQSILLSAPVADVFQLQHTRFVKGIDMDEVWETVCELRLPLIPSLPDLRATFGAKTPPPELIKTAIAFLILHSGRVQESIPSQPFASFLGPRPAFRRIQNIHLQVGEAGNEASQPYQPHNSMVTAVQQSALFSILLKRQKVMVPSRYASYVTATSDDNTKKIEDFMATTCHALPSMVFVDCSTLKRHVQGELLRKVEHILLRCHISNELRNKDGVRTISAIVNLLKPLLHRGSKLQHITFEKCTDDVLNIITSRVGELLTSNTEHTVERVSISVYDFGKRNPYYPSRSARQYAHTNQYFYKNQDYGFCGNARDWAFEALESRSQKASRDLGLMIPHISALHTLKLRNWWTRYSEHAHPDHVNLLDVLCTFLKQPHFQCLSLVDTCLPLVYIQRIVRAFLQSPCSQPQTLQLEMLSLTSRLGLIRTLMGKYSSDKKTLGILHRQFGHYPTDEEIKLPLTEWESQDSHSTISKAALAFKTLAIAFHSGGEGHYRKDDLATLEATRSWLSNLSRFKYELKSLIVQGDPWCTTEGSGLA